MSLSNTQELESTTATIVDIDGTFATIKYNDIMRRPDLCGQTKILLRKELSEDIELHSMVLVTFKPKKTHLGVINVINQIRGV